MRDKSFEKLPVRRISGVYNTPHFNITILESDTPNTDVYVEPHRHDYYHIMLVKNGIGKHSIDFKTYNIKPNTMFFVSPGQIHTLNIDKDALGYVISFNADFFQLYNGVQKLSDLPFFHSNTQAPVVYLKEDELRVLDLWENINDEHLKPQSNSDKMIRALLDVLLIHVARIHHKTPEGSNITSQLSIQINTLETLIDTHFRALKQVNDYAELMHLSAKHLNSLSKKALNKTVTNLIHERLILEAKRLLLFTDNTITEIAFELGFSDKSYFMRFFKKHTGGTAEMFRKQN